jgi:hypothetical protein
MAFIAATPGIGTFNGTYNTKTKKLPWTIAYSVLLGPVTRADFHGSAGVGKYGSFKVRVIVNHSPIEDSAILTTPTAKAIDNDLLNGRFISISTLPFTRAVRSVAESRKLCRAALRPAEASATRTQRHNNQMDAVRCVRKPS